MIYLLVGTSSQNLVQNFVVFATKCDPERVHVTRFPFGTLSEVPRGDASVERKVCDEGKWVNKTFRSSGRIMFGSVQCRKGPLIGWQ